jgi:hypothetical protein
VLRAIRLQCESRRLRDEVRRSIDESRRLYTLPDWAAERAAWILRISRPHQEDRERPKSDSQPLPPRRLKLGGRHASRVAGSHGIGVDGGPETQELARQLAEALEELREVEARQGWGAELRDAEQRVRLARFGLSALRRRELYWRGFPRSPGDD